MGLRQIRTGSWGGKRVGAAVLAVVLSATVGAWMAQARAPAPSESVAASVSVISLPAQGRDVLAQIHQGGPFRYEKDGTVFHNRERLLPRQTRGYYREYTVPTPGLRHRGARRIVCGGDKPQIPDACYYTEDHYSSFRLIVQ